MTIDALIRQLDALEQRTVTGLLAGLDRMAGIIENAMQRDPAHGDVTYATHANYAAKVYGPGRDPSASTASQAAVVEALNPGQVATAPLTVPAGTVGVILDSVTDYQRDLETGYAGNKAVLGPTIATSGDDFTRAAAQGAREALR